MQTKYATKKEISQVFGRPTPSRRFSINGGGKMEIDLQEKRKWAHSHREKIDSFQYDNVNDAIDEMRVLEEEHIDEKLMLASIVIVIGVIGALATLCYGIFKVIVG